MKIGMRQRQPGMNWLPITLLVLAGAMSPCTALAQETPAKSLADFELVGDGEADDTAAIQSAVDSGLGDLHFPKGTYRLSRPIVVQLDRVGRTSIHGNGVARFEMHGPGPAFQFVGTHDGTAAPMTVKSGVWDKQSTPLVDGIEIVGHHEDADGIQANGTMQLPLSRVSIRAAHHA
ncbi:MAG: hypothetical protein HKN47_01215, partial [Pirellulaceae bacterium]|nr:hypothetical protein [Pirellulaceae bacterium]